MRKALHVIVTQDKEFKSCFYYTRRAINHQQHLHFNIELKEYISQAFTKSKKCINYLKFCKGLKNL